jgi:indolepyruvate ferredoxin oxidoreductase alpha subunit
LEVSFVEEIQSLRLQDGERFHGEGILAVTKALLQSGVAYVGGYQGAPVSHLLDVMVQAKPLMQELGVHVEACSNEASAAAMLGASIHYPVRGAVTWKSIVGTNVASDALSNLSSPGVVGGALIVVGEDYGEGASVIQERTHAYALKSTMCLLDPRPDLARMVELVEHGLPCLKPRTCRAFWNCAFAPVMCVAVFWPRTTAHPSSLPATRCRNPPASITCGWRTRQSRSNRKNASCKSACPQRASTSSNTV